MLTNITIKINALFHKLVSMCFRYYTQHQFYVYIIYIYYIYIYIYVCIKFNIKCNLLR